MNETMENMNNINIDEAVEQAMAVVSATPKVSWKKFGLVVGTIGAVGAIGYGIYHHFAKKTKGEDQTDEAVDNVEVAKRDFLDEESEEE